MRRVLFPIGFALSLAIAASSFASLMSTDEAETGVAPRAQQTFFIPQNGAVSASECLADHNGCGQAAAASVCESKGFTHVVAFGEAAPEDTTGSITAAGQHVKVAQKKDVPVMVTCSR